MISSDDLEAKFPDMSPISSPPTLFTMNGCGLTIYGNRDRDAATQTYVKTRSICLIFIPIIPIDAYRVADADQASATR